VRDRFEVGEGSPLGKRVVRRGRARSIPEVVDPGLDRRAGEREARVAVLRGLQCAAEHHGVPASIDPVEQDDELRIAIPATMSAAEEARWVRDMTRRFERRAKAAPIDLAARARVRASRHRLPLPSSIRWGREPAHTLGSCTASAGSVRISTALAQHPRWVPDCVIVHELAHLAEPNHGRGFWTFAGRTR
jgi:hypothetical protein